MPTCASPNGVHRYFLVFHCVCEAHVASCRGELKASCAASLLVLFSVALSDDDYAELARCVAAATAPLPPPAPAEFTVQPVMVPLLSALQDQVSSAAFCRRTTIGNQRFDAFHFL